ncbi:unnamed protein product [Cochlearia groenlandica]
MAKLSGILVIMMMMMVAFIGMMSSVEATPSKDKKWLTCFRKCSKPCGDNDGNCFERCKIKCGGPNPPHGPPSHFSQRVLKRMASMETRG